MFKRSMLSVTTLLVVMSLALFGAGCVGNNSDDGGEAIMVKGSDTVLPLAQAEAEVFMNENPGKYVSIIGGGSGVGIAALIDGEVDIAMTSRAMKDVEIENAHNNGINPLQHTIAWDGISVIVNPENPISELTFEQIKAIYVGDVSNWNEVGGEDREIVVLSRDSSSGTYEYFKDEVLEGNEFRADALINPSTGSIIQTVMQNKAAIGYAGVAYLGNDVKALAVDAGEGAEEPTAENILSGAYPLARPLYFYTDGEPAGLNLEFIEFISSELGSETVLEVGYFPA
ncbi:phosphate ABC transporter substrate-binding protein [Methanococcoides seepicolus]|uniref:Phosphate ABC transporter substrate-binding protein n=1 Tax=Methanococcoides seepicolus TaxID=2828780 RepID=A0A9E4ZHA5_9EURY|nr:phosphate ABC transporter substrate-binding protein [Methanococcoides seepicolus]MCM1987647.1 phosphate ABC transporter substrate-binding protein [Methanococcoides seepicolus]